ncbi:serine hydrolase domain-containing protein [Caulobacter sp. UC70_42]|uniref:serine hydrolase domain-containing protein n=1 Tax=Caulobacter sp. UC70_42 TaxID=3374551 RepID=UPI003757C9E4
MALISDSSATEAAVAVDGLPRARPSAVGVDGARIAGFMREALEAGLELHAVMLHRHGHVAVDAAWWPYRTDTPRVMHSVAKSVTACAIGLALEEGRFALNDKVVSFFPQHLPPVVDEKLAAMTVEDLLTMRTGHAAETSGALWRGSSESWIAKFFGIPITHPPGGAYVYTSAASYMLAAILSRTTGLTLHDYLKPRLFEPLGITGEQWDIGSDGINPGGNGLTFKPVDLLKIGALHAQNGVWNGRRLLPADWVARATRAYGDGGYGYHWVVRPDGSYSALGLFVQMATVFPQAEATLVVLGAIDGSEKIAPFIDRWIPRRPARRVRGRRRGARRSPVTPAAAQAAELRARQHPPPGERRHLPDGRQPARSAGRAAGLREGPLRVHPRRRGRRARHHGGVPGLDRRRHRHARPRPAPWLRPSRRVRSGRRRAGQRDHHAPDLDLPRHRLSRHRLVPLRGRAPDAHPHRERQFRRLGLAGTDGDRRPES